jgi:AraC family transcriptional regulator
VHREEGVLARSAAVNGFSVGEITFAPGYVQPEYEPDLPYLAVLVEGKMSKSLHGGIDVETGNGLTMPAGARHGARFGRDGARVVIVKVRDEGSPAARSLDRLVELRGLAWLAHRLSRELRASDAAAPLALEGLALELLAAATRQADGRTKSAPRWLASAEDVLRARTGQCVRLSYLAAEVGVEPLRLARAFRAHRGVSVGEYGRRLRIEWAASEVTAGERPLAEIAVEAGFADQSHFTRLFQRYVGTTPARYRAYHSG